jgi:hypothetical protein
MLALFIMIQLAPCAPLFLKNGHASHHVTRECVGDCNICGCSPESRAAHTCCCWRKKLKEQHNHENVPECCKKKRHNTQMISSNCPCGERKSAPFLYAENTEILPYRFDLAATGQDGKTLSFIYPHRLMSRYGEPPDPPPKLTT